MLDSYVPAGQVKQFPFVLSQVKQDDEQFIQAFVPPVEKVPDKQVLQVKLPSNPNPVGHDKQLPVLLSQVRHELSQIEQFGLAQG